MPFFFDSLADHPAYSVLAMLQGAFTIWMLVDTWQRGQDQIWFWVILWFQPLGPWVYFVAVKVGSLRSRNAHAAGSWLTNLLHRRPSLDVLRYQAENVPTLASRLALAERLMEAREYEEAVPLLVVALKSEPGYGHVGYSLALCHVRLGVPDAAIPLLRAVLERDPRWRDYAAWRLLIDAQVAHGAADDALGSCRGLARLSPTLENHCLLAEQLIAMGHSEEARVLLGSSLRDYDFAPGPSRRRNRRWAGEARRLLKEIAGGG
jgi:hypothetical protein